MKSVNQRVLFIIDNFCGGKKAEFARKVGETPQTINGWLGRKMSFGTAQKITRAFPNVGTGWLLTGEGEQPKVHAECQIPFESNALIAEEPIKNYTNGIPYYNTDLISGFDIMFNDQTTTPEYLIDFRPYNTADCWCNVSGHSMEPEISHGDIIALKKIEDLSFIPYGEIYAIATSNGLRTIKRIGPSQDKNSYSLIPTNKSPEYGIQEIPKKMITHIFQVLGCMKKL